MKNDEQVYPFAIVPVEVVMDTRLTLESMRVLVALYSFRDKDTGLAFPSREAISVRCGMHPSNISDATTKLASLGWLKKTGSGGYSKATRYTIQIPEEIAGQATLHREKSEARKETKVAQAATVAEQATIAQSAIRESSPSGYPQNSPAGYTQRTDQLTDQGTNQFLPEESGNPKTPSPKDKDTAFQAVCRATWESYKGAYVIRYNTAPIRNAETNTAIKNFCKKLPHEEAPKVAAFYLSSNKKYYVDNQHPAPAMSKDATGLRTLWATNSRPRNTQEALEESNRSTTSGWMPPELREKHHAY